MNASDSGLAHVTAGVPLQSGPIRARPSGRIGGIVAIDAFSPQAVEAMARALGEGATILDEHTDLVADWDACWLDDQRIADLAAWRTVLERDRLSDVRGAFALAWRDESGEICLCRDAIGERTLYWNADERRIAFASTLRALLATGLISRDIDPISIAAYLSFAYLPGERTLIRGVRELLPGEMVRWRASNLHRRRIWALAAEPAPVDDLDEAHEAEQLRRVLECSVRRRLPECADEPVGATLSGGIDSSLVVALACRMHRAPLHTYSISFGPQYRNELEFSSLVAAHCGSVHRVLEFSPDAIVQHLDQTIALLSDPIGDPLTVPNALAFREAARDVGVVLNGEGGDPCFGGPKNLPMLLAQLLGDGGDGGPISASGPEATGAHGRERSYLRAHEKCFDDLAQMLLPGMLGALSDQPLERFVAEHFADARWCSFVTRLQALNLALKGAHHILHKIDEVSFAFGVLPRSPLFDRDVVEFAFALAPTLRLRGAVEKYLLKRSVRDLLPRIIIDRPKSGMLVPVEAWFRGPLKAHAYERLLDGLTRWNLFERSYLERLLAGTLPGLRPRHGAKIWLLVTLEAWLRTVVGA